MFVAHICSLDVNIERYHTNAVVYNTGDVLWIPPAKYTTRCGQTPSNNWQCNFDLASWTYDGFKLDLAMYENKAEVDLTDFRPLSRFNVVENTAEIERKYYPCCEEPYPSLKIELTLADKD